MNKKEIEEFIRFVSESGVSEVRLETKEIKIAIVNTHPHQEQIVTYATPPMHEAISSNAPVAKVEAVPSKKEPAAVDESHLHIIKSPMIGTFYRSSSPDKPNFINVGDEVKPGKIICIIEAMKLFNEIECDVSGKIVKVLAENAAPVEYDQPLFLVEPS